jgi:DNA-binding NtrC family response regulator
MEDRVNPETGSVMDKPIRPRRVMPRNGRGSPAAIERQALVFSRDESIVGLIANGLNDGWRLERCLNPSDARSFLVKAGVGVVIIDDGAIEQGTRGWLLDQVRKWAPDALVAYIAANHTPEIERQARSHNVQYYASQPIDPERTVRILRSFIGAAR